MKLTMQERSQVRRATTRINTVERRTFESSSSAKTYTTIVLQGGRVQCDCQGWTIKKMGKPRQCKHTAEIVGARDMHTDGEFIYISSLLTEEERLLRLPYDV